MAMENETSTPEHKSTSASADDAAMAVPAQPSPVGSVDEPDQSMHDEYY